jgi:hypothetical protein
MPRNGSGSFSLVSNSWNPAQNGQSATAADWQTLINDIASAISQSLSRDGQTSLTGDLPMGGNKLTGLAPGDAEGDSLRWEQLFSQGLYQDLASAATTEIGDQNSTLVNITGTTAITSFGTSYNGPRFLRFDGVLTLTNSSTLALPGGANITTAAGDHAIAVPLGNPATGWRVILYAPAIGISNKSPLGSLTCTVASSALTGTLAAETLDFRSTTVASGTPVTRIAPAAVSLIVPTGATLGTTSGVQARIYWGWIDNAGTLEPFVVSTPNGFFLDETTLVNTTAISSAAGTAGVFYTTTARSNVAYRVRGFCDITESTAGTWSSAPTLVQGFGGQSGVMLRPELASLTVSAASNALIASFPAESLDFRSATLTSGAALKRTLPAPAILTVPSGATLGMTSAVAGRLYFGLLDNAGTLEPFVVNPSTGVSLDETGLISTTTISSSANTAGVFYSNSARTNVAYRIRGFCDISETTAGTWASNPTLVQGVGGQALAAMASLGYGQKWTDVGASRIVGTTYYNTTGKPITVNIIVGVNSGVSAYFYVNGQIVSAASVGASASGMFMSAIVPSGASYVMTQSGGAVVAFWVELR